MIEQASSSDTASIGFPLPAGDVVAVEERPVTGAFERIKRVMDVVLAVIGLVLTSPLLLLAMAVICAVSPGSPIFAQSRIGRPGNPFMMYKLWTLSKAAALKRESMHMVIDT